MRGTFIPDFLISGLTPEGTPFGMFGDIQVMVEKAIPGEVADIQMIKSFKDKTIARGKILQLKKPSPSRQQPFCKHFTYCGGCQWQMLPYEEQLKLKQRQAVQFKVQSLKFKENNVILSEAKSLHATETYSGNLHSHFSILNSQFPPLPSPQQLHYRNRITFTFSNRRWMAPEEVQSSKFKVQSEKNEDACSQVTDSSILNSQLSIINSAPTAAAGFALKGKNDRVMQIEECFLADPFAIRCMKALQHYALKQGFTFYDARHERGFLRALTLRFGDGNEIMAILTFGEHAPEKINIILKFIQNEFPEITSLYYVIHPRKRGMISDKEHIHVYGHKHLSYIIKLSNYQTIKLNISPSAFYQTNTRQALQLFHTAKAFAGLQGDEILYDLYTGSGAIALYAADAARHVVGLEYDEAAVEDARQNALLNHITNATFLSGDMKKIFNKERFALHGQPDVVITDPPRAGMERAVLQQLVESGAGKIVYISCNPVTQARDIRWLSPKYSPVKSQMVDMFPHTSHIENIVLLEKTKSKVHSP